MGSTDRDELIGPAESRSASAMITRLSEFVSPVASCVPGGLPVTSPVVVKQMNEERGSDCAQMVVRSLRYSLQKSSAAGTASSLPRMSPLN
jgi:hypothetical protein